MKKDPSGRFVLRLPPGIHQALRKEASIRAMSLNAVCQQALEAHVSGNTRFRPGETETSSMVAGIRELLGNALMGVVMFGSAARGESREGSDVDLLLVLERERPLTRNLYSLWDERFRTSVQSPHFVHMPASPTRAGSLWLEASVDGVVFYDRDGAVARFLGRIRQLIASGRLRRRWAYGHPYWVKAEGAEGNVQ
jgi:hypothetical protein